MKTELEKKTIYNKILKLIEKGYTIEDSCIITNISRSMFYRVLNETQKIELKNYKISNSKCNKKY
jgi:hypothetical protein